VTGIF